MGSNARFGQSRINLRNIFGKNRLGDFERIVHRHKRKARAESFAEGHGIYLLPCFAAVIAKIQRGRRSRTNGTDIQPFARDRRAEGCLRLDCDSVHARHDIVALVYVELRIVTGDRDLETACGISFRLRDQYGEAGLPACIVPAGHFYDEIRHVIFARNGCVLDIDDDGVFRIRSPRGVERKPVRAVFAAHKGDIFGMIRIRVGQRMFDFVEVHRKLLVFRFAYRQG